MAILLTGGGVKLRTAENAKIGLLSVVAPGAATGVFDAFGGL